MRTKIKALVVVGAMLTTFAILPTLGAAAAEPLEDGSYAVTVGATTHTLEVIDGVPVVDERSGIIWDFAFNDDGRVLDEFAVAVGELRYEVEVADDGTAYAAVDGDPETADEEAGAPLERVVDEPATEEQDEVDEDDEDEDDEDDDANDDNHGQLVSSVAQGAPSGKVAREAGLPNHGTFARAAARGETVDFEVDGEAYTADLTTPEGAAAFCALVEELIAAAEDTPTEDSPAEGDPDEAEDTESSDEDSEGKPGNGNGRDKGTETATATVGTQPRARPRRATDRPLIGFVDAAPPGRRRRVRPPRSRAHDGRAARGRAGAWPNGCRWSSRARR